MYVRKIEISTLVFTIYLAKIWKAVKVVKQSDFAKHMHGHSSHLTVFAFIVLYMYPFLKQKLTFLLTFHRIEYV